ncbi:TPA: hypothetical protein L3677_006542 [Pseudomonas aeruginosa]|nr:hypothetical protein [Pseudomonas aeruginosa]HBN8237163.1 hypothetical protein [Pseudomonas aeruginosa]
MSIDWSKAPEGANKAGFTGPDNYLQFYRIPGRFGDYDYWSEKRGWCGNNFPTCADHLFERPAKVEWDGQGLPPVGTVCIVEPHNTMWGFSSTSGYERKILAYYGEYVWLGHAETPLETTRIDKVDFRPIRTPEQIAAEERAKAIEEMLSYEIGLALTTRRKFCEVLFDAGYRRQEEGK